jgi:glucokinase
MARSSVTETNQFLVLDAIRSARATTRPELAARLDLSPASISRIVRRLLAGGLVIEEPGPSDGVGRNRDVLRYNQRAGAVIAIDLGGTKCHGAVADLVGCIVAEDERPAFAGGSPAGSLLASIATLREAAAREHLAVQAVSVGIPALVNPDTGLVDAGPNVHWHGFDLMGLLRSELTEPFTVDNDVNLAGLGEAWRGGGAGVSSFVTLSLGTGIGAAIVLDGRLVRGQHNAAGEVGYLVTRPSQILRGVPGPAAGLEELISGSALTDRARELAKASPGRTGMELEALTPAMLFEAAPAGDEVALAVIGELIETVAITVAAVTALLDPARVIVDGSIGRALAPYLSQIEALVGQVTYRAPEIVTSTLGPNATVTGAIASALAMLRDADAPRLPNVRTAVSPP